MTRKQEGKLSESRKEVEKLGSNGFITSANAKRIESAVVTETTSGAIKILVAKQKSQLRPVEVTYAFTLPGIKIVKLF